MKKLILIASIIILFPFFLTDRSQAGNRGKVVDASTIEKITAVMPDKAPATPKKPRKVLVYSKCSGFYHGSIPTGNKCMEIMAEKTGAFEAVVSDDLANFEADKLKEFDAIILNNTTGELLLTGQPRKPREPNAKRIKDAGKLEQAKKRYEADLAKWKAEVEKLKAQPDRGPELRENLMAWIKSGKGVVGIHAATDCSYKWKEYGEMMGGYFTGHPWHMPVAVKNDDPGNPINAIFDGNGFEVTDEIYQFARGAYDRKNQRTILSLDMEKTQNKGKREDKDYAVSWVKKHGEGRIFYCSLGHRNEIFWNPAVLQHYLAGIQWAVGDLENVDTTPNPL